LAIVFLNPWAAALGGFAMLLEAFIAQAVKAIHQL